MSGNRYEILTLTRELHEFWQTCMSFPLGKPTDVIEKKAQDLRTAVDLAESGEDYIRAAVEALEGHDAHMRINAIQKVFWNAMVRGGDEVRLARQSLEDCMKEIESGFLAEAWRTTPVWKSAIFDVI